MSTNENTDINETGFVKRTRAEFMCCENCAYFKEDVRYYGKETSMGICRRHAPKPVTVAEEWVTLITVWPQVSYTDHCGEWKEK